MAYVILILAAVLFALQAIKARHLMNSVLCLAGVSAILSIVFYLLGAQMIAVIELSVGAGLVTVLFVYVINIAGEGGSDTPPLINKWLALGLVASAVLLLGMYLLHTTVKSTLGTELDLSLVIWQERALDILVQVVLIFAGVLGLLGLLAETKATLKYPMAEEVAASRQKELEAMTRQSIEQEIL